MSNAPVPQVPQVPQPMVPQVPQVPQPVVPQVPQAAAPQVPQPMVPQVPQAQAPQVPQVPQPVQAPQVQAVEQPQVQPMVPQSPVQPMVPQQTAPIGMPQAAVPQGIPQGVPYDPLANAMAQDGLLGALSQVAFGDVPDSSMAMLLDPDLEYEGTITELSVGPNRNGDNNIQLKITVDFCSDAASPSKYNGAVLYDNIPILETTRWRIKSLGSAIGAMSADKSQWILPSAQCKGRRVRFKVITDTYQDRKKSKIDGAYGPSQFSNPS